MKPSILVVVAHPDDEVLGCGGTVAEMTRRGAAARSCVLCGDVDVRQHRPEDPDLKADTLEAQRLLGLGAPILGSFPNIRLNTVPHLELVQFIEQAIQETGADTLFTHHPADLNDDHAQVSRACMAASRLFQRRAGVPPLRSLYFMEILSATDWSFPAATLPFAADTFSHIGEEGLDRKIKALAAYRGVMRPFPHPRSEEILRGLAAYRGGQAGLEYAEAFQTAFRLSI